MLSTIYPPLELDEDEAPTGIYGHEVASIYQIDGCPTIQRLYAIKTGEEEPDEESLYTKSWSLHVSPFLVTWFNKTFEKNKRWLESRLGVKLQSIDIDESNAVYQHAKYPFMLADTKRLVELKKENGESMRGIFLCKTPHYLEFDKWGWNEVPSEVELQARHEMAVMNMDFTIVVCNVGNNEADYCSAVILRDYGEEKLMIEAESTFWNKHVLSNVMPKYTTDDDNIDDLFSSNIKEALENGKICNMTSVSDDVIDAAKGFHEAKTKAKLMEKKGDEYRGVMCKDKTMLLEAMATKPTVEVKDKTMIYAIGRRAGNKRGLDSERIKRERQDIYRQYAKESPVEKFNVEIADKTI